MQPPLELNREFLVFVTKNEAGEVTGLRVRDDPRVGKVVRLFSSKEKLDNFLASSDENQRFMDMLEQLPEGHTSNDLHGTGDYLSVSVRELAPLLEAYDVDLLAVDPLPDGFYYTYLPPHKA